MNAIGDIIKNAQQEKFVFKGLYCVREIEPRKPGCSETPNGKSHHLTTGEAVELRTLKPATGLKWIKPPFPFWHRGQCQHTTGGLSWSQRSTPGSPQMHPSVPIEPVPRLLTVLGNRGSDLLGRFG
jgi:hypothetical protein